MLVIHSRLYLWGAGSSPPRMEDHLPSTRPVNHHTQLFVWFWFFDLSPFTSNTYTTRVPVDSPSTRMPPRMIHAWSPVKIPLPCLIIGSWSWLGSWVGSWKSSVLKMTPVDLDVVGSRASTNVVHNLAIASPLNFSFPQLSVSRPFN